MLHMYQFLCVTLQVNTFQVVMITDGQLSFVIFNYQRITWTIAINSNGASTTPAAVSALYDRIDELT
jgi:hypothetical protein